MFTLIVLIIAMVVCPPVFWVVYAFTRGVGNGIKFLLIRWIRRL